MKPQRGGRVRCSAWLGSIRASGVRLLWRGLEKVIYRLDGKARRLRVRIRRAHRQLSLKRKILGFKLRILAQKAVYLSLMCQRVELRCAGRIRQRFPRLFWHVVRPLWFGVLPPNENSSAAGADKRGDS